MVSTKNPYTNNDIFITRLDTDDKTLYIGISKAGKMLSYSIVSHAMSYVYELPSKVLREVKNVEFVLLDGVKDVLSYDQWRETAGIEEDTTNEKFKYIEFLKALNVSEQMDRAWNDLQMGCSTYTGAFAFQIAGSGACYHKYDTIEGLSVHEPIRETLTGWLENIYGEGNAFVSRQVVTLPTAMQNWQDFCDQAHVWLIQKERYWKAIYDQQLHPGGQLALPGYVIPVGVRKDWARCFAISEHTDFVQQLSSPLATDKSFRIVYESMYGYPLRYYICSLDDIAVLQQELLDVAYKIAELDGIYLPGQPTKCDIALKKIFSRIHALKNKLTGEKNLSATLEDTLALRSRCFSAREGGDHDRHN